MLFLPESDTTFTRGPEADSREELAGASLRAGTLSSARFSVNSCNHPGRSSNGFPRTFSLSPFFISFFQYLVVHATGFAYDLRTSHRLTRIAGIDRTP